MGNEQQNTQILKPVTINFTKEQVEVLKNTIAKDATESELNLFVQACISYGLDPFKKELFFAKNKNTGRVDLITSRDGYLTIAQRDPRYLGLQSMEVYSNDNFTMEYDGEGGMNVYHEITEIDKTKRGDIIGAWATCKFKDRDDATAFVYMDEYKKMGYDNWNNYPSAMIRKVPESIVLKRQGGISGLVTQEEIGFIPESMQLTSPKQVENTPEDIPRNQSAPTDKNHPEPKDVTNQYKTETDDSGNKKVPNVIQISAGDMFIEYQVDNVNRVVKSGEGVHR